MMTKLLTYMESMKEEIMQDKKKKAKCDKESLEERNLLAEDDDEGEADSLDLNEEASYDDILSIVEMVVKEQMDHITNVVDELKGSMEKLEALDVKETKLEKLETLEKKSEAVDTKLKTLEEKLEVADQKMDEMKNMIAQLLEQVAKQSSVTETDEK